MVCAAMDSISEMMFPILAEVSFIRAMASIMVSINQISGVVESNAATAEEASATSQELSAQATMLDELVGQFELKRK